MVLHRFFIGAFVTVLISSCQGPTTRAPEGAGPTSTPAPPPNVMIIMTDDQRPILSTMPKTKRWFKAGGTHFPRAIVTTPTCCPSRASVMSGTYAHNHGVQDSDGWGHLLDQSWSLPRYLSDAGYRTGIFGKYFNEWDPSNDPPHFERWATMNDAAERGYRGGTWNVQGSVKTINRYSTRFIESHAMEFIKQGQDDSRPWYLYVTPWAPHGPAIPARRYAEAPVPRFRKNPAMSEADRSDKPPYVQDTSTPRRRIRKLRANQLRTLMSVDDMIDRFLQELQDDGQLDDTLIFFTSDNGLHWGEQGLGAKRAPYLSSLRVPLYARWPGRFETGKTDDRLVANIDLAPTILEAAGIIPEHQVDGRSLLSPFERDHLLIEMWSRDDRRQPDWAGLLSKTYAYIEYFRPDRETQIFSEYYDLGEDPWQLENLLVPGPPSAIDDATLSEQLSQEMSCRGTTGASACP